MKSREGIEFKDYNFRQLAIAFIPAVFLGVVFKVCSFFCVDESSYLPDIPDKTLILGFHRELVFFFCSKKIWKDYLSRGTSWIGIHHWSSYAGSLELWLRGFLAFRYDRRLKTKPLEQITQYLKTFQGPVFIRVDAGGPYDQVKISTIRMALESERGVICFRQRATRSFSSKKLTGTHLFPWPFARVKTSYSEFIPFEKLKSMALSEARDYVQSKMELS